MNFGVRGFIFSANFNALSLYMYIQSKVWESPRVLINTTVGPPLMQQLTDIVKRMQVQVYIERLYRKSNVYECLHNMIIYLTHAHLHSHSPHHYYNICVLDLGCYQWECWGCDPRHLPSSSPQSFRWGVCTSPVPEGEECPRSLVVLPQQVCVYVCLSVHSVS